MTSLIRVYLSISAAILVLAGPALPQTNVGADKSADAIVKDISMDQLATLIDGFGFTNIKPGQKNDYRFLDAKYKRDRSVIFIEGGSMIMERDFDISRGVTADWITRSIADFRDDLDLVDNGL